MNNMPVDQDYLFLNSRGNFICVEHLISHLDKALAKNGVELIEKRKSYFFRHYMAIYWHIPKSIKVMLWIWLGILVIRILTLLMRTTSSHLNKTIILLKI